MREYVLEAEHICRRYAGIQAVTDMRFDLRPGEVHALTGMSGAGKSAFVHLAAGLDCRFDGTLRLDGQPVRFASVREAMDAGICLVPQEAGTLPDMTAAQYMFLGNEISRGILTCERAMETECRIAFEKYRLAIRPDVPLRSLSAAQRQFVAILRAVMRQPRILILDEPAAALPEADRERLSGLMCELKKNGMSVIYVTAHPDEVLRVSDRVTVMRDGEYVGTLETGETGREQLMQLMRGSRTLPERKKESSVPENSPVALEVKGLTRYGAFRDVTFSVRKGEILGFAGLTGAGHRSLMRAVFGLDGPDTGEIRVNGKTVRIRSPRDAGTCGLRYIKGKAVLEMSAGGVVICDEPFSGMRTEEREAAVMRLEKAAAEGTAVLLMTADRTELLRLADRVCVMRGGELTDTLDIADAAPEKLTALMTREKDMK